MEEYEVHWRDEFGFIDRTRAIPKKDAVKVRDALKARGVTCEVVRVPDSPQPPSPLL